MSTSLIYQAEDAPPRALHALVIGVGTYPHLLGGKGPLWDGHDNMGQLSSPPISARRFAEWLLRANGYHHPDVPLGSLRLLLSEHHGLLPKKFVVPQTGERRAVPPATLAAVKEAAEEWTAALRTSEQHRSLFFFSGHGASAGMEQSLLLSDIGAGLNTPYGPSIRFSAFRNGMRTVAAREQFYFIDACRTLSEELAAAYGAAGDPLVTPNPRVELSREPTVAIFDATVEGKGAFGRRSGPSLFTEALLDALQGGGGDNSDADERWKIETNMLNRSVQWLVERAAARERLRVGQAGSARETPSLYFSHLREAPLTPVGLSCDPDLATPAALFSSGGGPGWRAADRDPLFPLGTHEFQATFPRNDFAGGAGKRAISPPFKEVRIAVERRG